MQSSSTPMPPPSLAQQAASTGIHSPFRIAIVAPLTPLSGNLTTTQRLVNLLKDPTIACLHPFPSSLPHVSVDVLDAKSKPSSPSTSTTVLTDGPAAVITNQPEYLVPSPIYYDVCFVLHAYRGGKYLFPSIDDERDAANHHNQPTVMARRYVLIFGGTDVNEGSVDGGVHEFGTEGAREAMRLVIERMDAVVCFSQSLADAARAVWPRIQWGHVDSLGPLQPSVLPPRDGTLPMYVIPQSVEPLIPCPQQRLPTTLLDALLTQCNIPQEELPHCRVVILPGGIRRVKCPEYAIEAFQEMCDILRQQCINTRVTPVLLLIGPLLQPCYLKGPLSTACSHHLTASSSSTPPFTNPQFQLAHTSPSTSGVVANDNRNASVVAWVDGLPKSQLACLVCDPRCISTINTSLSEGQPQALLEVMGSKATSCVVVGRNIAANEEVVRHGDTGYLAASPKEMGSILAEQVCLSLPLCQQHSTPSTSTTTMVAAAKAYVNEHHSLSLEGVRYWRMLSTLFPQAS